MSKKIIRINPLSPEPAVILEAATILRRGDLIVAPTDTRYGLLAHGLDPRAVSRLYEVKGRAWNRPTAIFVPSVEDIGRYGVMSPVAQRLAERYLPGAVTLVLKAIVDWGAPRVVDGKVGIRVVATPIILALLTEVGSPLTATSANLAGKPEVTTVEEVMRDLGKGVAMYLDGGRLEGQTSTVVDCSGEAAVVIREGAIPTAEIMRDAMAI